MKNHKQSKAKEITDTHAHLPDKKNQVIRMDKCTQITMDVKYIALLTNGDLIGKIRIGSGYTKVQYDSKHTNWRLL